MSQVVVAGHEVPENLRITIGLKGPKRKLPVMFALSNAPGPLDRGAGSLKDINPNVPRACCHFPMIGR